MSAKTMTDEAIRWTVTFIYFDGSRVVETEFFQRSGKYEEVKQRYTNQGYEEAVYDRVHDEWPHLRPADFEPGTDHQFFAVVPPFTYSGNYVKKARKERAQRLAASWLEPEKVCSFSDLPDLLKTKIRFGTRRCWLWAGRINLAGYGLVRYENQNELAHRLVYSLLAGEIPDSALLRHTCDNRMCVNPHHLKLGTTYDNNADTAARGKGILAPKRKGLLGSRPYYEGRKISLCEMREIRLLYFTGQSTVYKLARKYGFSRATVARILQYRTPISLD